MKNKKSPLKIIGAAMGTAGAALGTQHLLGRLGGLFGGNRGNTNFTGVGGLGEQYAGVGARPAGVVDASTQFNPGAQAAMQGIFGDISGRQASLGASGLHALNKHLSPLNKHDEIQAQIDAAKAKWDKEQPEGDFYETYAHLYKAKTKAEAAHKEEKNN